MAEWTDLYRSVVLPQYCDHYGHMNVRFYVQCFDDCGFHMWNLAGVNIPEQNAKELGLVIANISVNFHHEITSGSMLLIKGAWTKVGNRSVTYEQRLYNADTGVLCASQESVEVFFDTEARKAMDMPDDLRKAVTAALISPEAYDDKT